VRVTTIIPPHPALDEASLDIIAGDVSHSFGKRMHAFHGCHRVGLHRREQSDIAHVEIGGGGTWALDSSGHA
jgi:hypothetical protein